MIGNRYKSIQILGTGGFGSVYLAHDSITQSKVAVKFLANITPDAFTRFVREANIMWQNLHNPHVVRLLDHNFNNAPPYIVMEYCEHGSLRSLVGTNQSWQTIAVILGHVVQGLNNIHALGGFHRDLKPDNLLVARHPQLADGKIIKVSDFGLARIPETANAPMTRSWGGTEGYIAPEVMSGAPYTASADIYSLGIIATELLTGIKSVQTLGTVKIPDQLRKLIRAMLSPNPQARPTTQQIASSLHVLLNSPNVIATEEKMVAPKNGNSSSGVESLILGGFVIGGLILALSALAGDGAKPGGPPNVK